MEKRVYFPRLNRRDCERLLDVHQQLNRARDLLERTTSPVAHATSALIMSALILISELYNRAEQAFIETGGSTPGPSFQDGQVEIPPAAAPELAAPVPESEPGK
jgi:hypothetical protein